MLYYNHASSSGLECAACLDILVARKRIDSRLQAEGKQILHEIVSMLISMWHVAENRLQEDTAEYIVTDRKVSFDHERLDAYNAPLAFIAWMTEADPDPTCSSDLLTKMDKASTSVVLNIAAGNGRTSNADKIKFFKTASKANTQTSALLDIAYRNTKEIEQGRALLTKAGKCITGLIKSKE